MVLLLQLPSVMNLDIIIRQLYYEIRTLTNYVIYWYFNIFHIKN